MTMMRKSTFISLAVLFLSGLLILIQIRSLPDIFGWENSLQSLATLEDVMAAVVLPSATSNDQQDDPDPIRIAYAVSITDCPESTEPGKRNGIVDGPAVLAHAIHMNSVQHNHSHSRYDYKLYAFVHPDAQECTRHLSSLNYTVHILETPINASLIEKEVYRERVQNPSAGCCREKEFLKLYSLTVPTEPIVVHFDADATLLQPMDDLFDVMLLPDAAPKHLGHHAMWPEDRNLSRRIESFFTRDYPMGAPGWPIEHYGMQGGFWVVRPNRTAFDELCRLILQGNFNLGWYDGDVHYKGFYGAAMIQGLIGFYYGHVQPNQAVELDHCRHNNMVEDPKHHPSGRCLAPNCIDCRKFNLSQVHSFHATFCGKPWNCPVYSPHEARAPLCRQFMQAWYRTRHHLETIAWGRPSISNMSLTPPTSSSTARRPEHVVQHYGFCPSRFNTNGVRLHPSYVPMTFDGE